jgi:uncharacterized repeat protein (TIGR03803 family)
MKSLNLSLSYFLNLVLLVLGLGTFSLHAQYNVIFTFSGTAGDSPVGGLINSGNTFFGTAVNTNPGSNGFVYSIQGDGTAASYLHQFTGGPTDGSQPQGGLTLDGTVLYGTTQAGGSTDNGTIYKVSTDSTGYQSLLSFTGTSGAAPGSSAVTSLTISGSTIYGTTKTGGSANSGLVFKLNTDGTNYSVMKEFSNLDGGGYNPGAGLTLSGSTLFGSTLNGGVNDSGVLFKINTDGTGYGVLHEFTDYDGTSPSTKLTISGTKMFGTTLYGGSSGGGLVFSMDTDGSNFSILKEFDFNNGGLSFGALTLDGDTLYGTTYLGGASSNGVLFSMKTDGSEFTLLNEFLSGSSDGASPSGILALFNKKLYGTTESGGAGYGTIFFYAIPEPSTSGLVLLGVAVALYFNARRIRKN